VLLVTWMLIGLQPTSAWGGVGHGLRAMSFTHLVLSGGGSTTLSHSNIGILGSAQFMTPGPPEQVSSSVTLVIGMQESRAILSTIEYAGIVCSLRQAYIYEIIHIIV
jgi:hypothetical protein